jgi:two-component system, chemotaxis family, sensor kinase Cph1
VPFDVRTACDLLAQSLSVQIEATEQRMEYESRIRLKSDTARLLGYMAQENEFVEGIRQHPDDLMAFLQASGVAILANGECHRLGECPAEDDVRRLAGWMIATGRQELYWTNQLSVEIPDGERFRSAASGLLAMSISRLHQSFVFWFRPEVVQTVSWGGDPRKSTERNGQQAEGRIHPRKSFVAWKETVRNRSAPWSRVEVEAAGDLRNALLEILLSKAEELAELSAELQRSNKELEAFSYSVSHDLRAPFRHIIGYAELLKQSADDRLTERDERYLDVITKSAHFAGTLVDNLLNFSQVGRSKLKLQQIDMQLLVKEAIRDLETEVSNRQVEWQVRDLPQIEGDVFMLRLVWQNLLQNALKYTRNRDQAVVEIGGEKLDKETVFSVRDNGVGFDQAYADKLFGVFQRLHRMEDYEGTGVGLANVRRIVAKHGGTTWAEGKVDRGAEFFFSMPHRIRENG